ncbi:MAG: ATP-grasp domain-containing protein [Polyangiaceae bacterium]|nr:ATP-grasp domain-containing protein [Polyangiaceae bacterium]
MRSSSTILRSLGTAPRRDVLLLYADTSRVRLGLPTDELPDANVATMQPVVDALAELGHRVRALGVSYDDPSAVEAIEADVVLHLVDGSGLDGNPGLEVPAALERRGLHFCGAGSAFYQATSDKLGQKARLAAARVPAPLGGVMPHPDARLPPGLRYPLIVKPRDGFGSIGITEDSVVTGPGQLRRQVERLVGELDCDALVAEYVPGRELTVGVIGRGASAFTLPVLEAEFGEAYRDIPKIKTFRTKFDAASPLYHDFRAVCPARLDAATEQRVRHVALRAYRALGGDGYGRVDIRLADSGTPYVIEVNAQPSLEYGEADGDCASLPLIARGAGWSYAELFRHILATARTFDRLGGRRASPLAPRRHAGRTGVHATAALPKGMAVCALGDVHPVPELHADAACLRLEDGRPARIDPVLRHLEHAAEPNLRLATERATGALALVTTRAVAVGEALSLDRQQPLPLTALRRRLRCHGSRGAHPATAEALQAVG